MVNFISRSFTEKRGAEVESLLRINLVTAASNEGAFIIKSKCLMFFNVFFFLKRSASVPLKYVEAMLSPPVTLPGCIANPMEVSNAKTC